MKRSSLIAALVYATAAICLFEYLDFLSGMAQPGSRLRYLLMAGIALFATACMLSFFRMRWAVICALLGATLSWPLLSGQLFTVLGRDLFRELTYYPEVPTAVVSLLVASIFAAFQLRLFFSFFGGTSGHNAAWPLSVVAIYAVVVVTTANWPSIWGLFFRLRYGS